MEIAEMATHEIKRLNEIKGLRDTNKELLRVLKKLLPMQGCIICQDYYMYCDRHGDLPKTIEKAKEIIKKANKTQKL